jgi:phosphoribosylanthranilate isomerase
MERGLGVIKAFRVRDRTSLAEIGRYRATAYLLDAYIPGQPGGTGHSFDWTLAVQAKGYGPVILAGGLTPDNVLQAVRTIQPWGVDVSSGVEAAPGRKDPDKVRRFITAVKSSP